MVEKDTPLWSPPEDLIASSGMTDYMRWLESKKSLFFADYDELWKWSTDDPAVFWESLIDYFKVDFTGRFSEVMRQTGSEMIGTEWFPGINLNYAEHIFRNKTNEYPAIIFQSEKKTAVSISWQDLEDKVSSVAGWLKNHGVVPGDRVCGVLPNIPEAVIIFLAVNSIGAIWSSCSPDFGNSSIADRFEQIKPKILFVADGYTYNGKPFDKVPAITELIPLISSLEQTVLISFLDDQLQVPGTVSWNEVVETAGGILQFEKVPFNSPLWVLFSSGTTGKPKAITHSVGGCLVEHLKALSLHQDVKKGERYFWYSTTGWMMWNYSVASMLVGATLVIYEGSPGYPDLNTLWNFAKQTGINHFGGGAAFYISCMKAGLKFDKEYFPHLRTIGSTGSPLPAEAFEWIYNSIKKDVWLISLSGGTDICSCFVGGSPLLPVYAGEIQCRLLGCALDAVDENGNSVRNQLGEMIILKPMPSMPVFFWNDPENKRYHSSYFENYPGVWRHGDWISITSRNTIIIYGRSDATLNRDGIRIGTSEIYSAVESLPEISDSLVVCVEKSGGRFYMPLFVVIVKEFELDETLKKKINSRLRAQYSPRHVPDAIFRINSVPYTLSGKKMEMPVKKILMGQPPEKVASADTMKNPESLTQFQKVEDV